MAEIDNRNNNSSHHDTGGDFNHPTEESDTYEDEVTRREREIERLLAAQDHEDDLQRDANNHTIHNNNNNNNNMNNNNNQGNQNDRLFGQARDNENNNLGQGLEVAGGGGGNNNNNVEGGLLPPPHAAMATTTTSTTTPPRRLSYVQMSFLTAAASLYYAFRSRQQWYLTLVYLGSSKWACVVFGNACIALAVTLFDATAHLFLSGLRLQEAEGLQDFFRWNVTESCLALTLFRSELRASTAVQFLGLVLLKCLHHVAILRETHIRLTTEGVMVVVVPPRGGQQPPPTAPTEAPEAAAERHPPTDHAGNHQLPPAVETAVDAPPRGLLMIPFAHVKVLALLLVLQMIDLWIVQYTALELMTHGPSVQVLFAFEAAILLVAAWSHLLLWHLHALDGLLHAGHELESRWLSPFLHPWKEYKATLTFAVELQAQAIQFVFYLTFFGIILTYWGMPINLFREVYLSFTALKERLLAFLKYRRLMANMNTHFENVTEEHLQTVGRVCIICRDEMTPADCKQLPVCHHVFHKSCLREWLVQQQSCPTCRSDITANQAIEAARRAVARAALEREAQGLVQPLPADEEGEDSLEGKEEEEEGEEEEEEAQLADEAEEQCAEKAREHEPRHELVRRRPKQAAPFSGAIPSRAVVRLDQRVSQFSTSPADSVEPRQKLDRFHLPALMRVTVPDGTTVWSTKEKTTMVRCIPCGMVVLATEEAVGVERAHLLRIPDGWIQEEVVEAVLGLRKKQA